MTTNPNSILDSVKKILGFDAEYEAFDLDVTLFINSAFGSLQQLGVGGDTGFIISDNTTLWSQYVSDLIYLGMIKQFICMSVRLAFDPPQTSFGLEAIQNMINQLAWRINIEAEHINPPSDPFAPADASPGAGTTTTWFKVVAIEVPFASAINLDAGEANTFYLDLTGDCTINAPVSGSDGEHITVQIVSNGHTVTWGAGWNFGQAGTPDLSSSGQTDIISAIYRQSAADWYAGYTPGF